MAVLGVSALGMQVPFVLIAWHPVSQDAIQDCQEAPVQVGVAATRSIAVPSAADEGGAAEDFAASLMDKWGVGDAACNDGGLLLLSLQPRQVPFLINLSIPGPSTACPSVPSCLLSWHG